MAIICYYYYYCYEYKMNDKISLMMIMNYIMVIMRMRY